MWRLYVIVDLGGGWWAGIIDVDVFLGFEADGAYVLFALGGWVGCWYKNGWLFFMVGNDRLGLGHLDFCFTQN